MIDLTQFEGHTGDQWALDRECQYREKYVDACRVEIEPAGETITKIRLGGAREVYLGDISTPNALLLFAAPQLLEEVKELRRLGHWSVVRDLRRRLARYEPAPCGDHVACFDCINRDDCTVKEGDCDA